MDWIQRIICGVSDDADVPFCLTNVASGKPTKQKSTFIGGVSSRAVDGNTNGMWRGRSVTHTTETYSPSWSVDLVNRYYISQIKVYNRVDCCSDRLSGFKVIIRDDSHKVWDYIDNQTIPGAVTTIPVDPSVVGDKVKIIVPGQNKILSLAEVEVLGRLFYEPTESPSNETLTMPPTNDTSATMSPTICPSIFVSVTTDRYIDETSWTVVSSSGQVWRNEPFLLDKTTYTTDICIIETNCYTFTIKDSVGDGFEKPGTFYVSFGDRGSIVMRDDGKPFAKRSVELGDGCATTTSPPSYVSTTNSTMSGTEVTIAPSSYESIYNETSTFTIESQKTKGFCLELMSSENSNHGNYNNKKSSKESKIVLSQCNMTEIEGTFVWDFLSVADSPCDLIQSKATNECLATTMIADGDNNNNDLEFKDGTALTMKPCYGDDESQKWVFTDDGFLKPFADTSFCVDGNGPKKEVYLWQCDRSTDQYFEKKPFQEME